jgi:hypothetical protein
MTLLHSFRTVWRSEWQTPQNRIASCTSCGVGSRRRTVVAPSADVALAAEKALAEDIGGSVGRGSLDRCDRGETYAHRVVAETAGTCMAR